MKADEPRILFISTPIGLGHASRDLAIAEELRRQIPGVQLTWLSSGPAKRLLQEEGETIHPASEHWADDGKFIQQTAKGMRMSLAMAFSKYNKLFAGNVDIFRRVTATEHYDLAILDAAYDISAAIKRGKLAKSLPIVFICGWVGLDVLSKNPLEKLAAAVCNRLWAKGHKGKPITFDLGIILGEPEDIPDKRFGFGLPSRRELAKRWYQFVGHVSRCNPHAYIDRAKVREKLGYGPEPLVVCSIGGTAVGKELLELCGQAFQSVRESITDLRMVLVCGPRLSPEAIKVPVGVEVSGYVPRLYEHFAACDLAVVQGGGTSTYELAALRRPFIYFPLEHHCEQEVVAGRLTRYGAGVRMSYSKTTPQLLAEQIARNIGIEVNYPPVPLDGAKKAARLIAEFLSAHA